MSGRGEQRRAALVRAASLLLAEMGPETVTARAVAARAEVPLAAVSYYFRTVDDLLRQAAEEVFEAYLARATALVREPTGPALEETVVRVWLDPSDDGPDAARVRSTLLQLVQATGTPSLAASLRRWDADLVRLVEELLRDAGRDPSRTRLLLAALDGSALARLSGIDVGGGGPVADGTLLEGLMGDLRLVLDDLAPVTAPEPGREVAQNSRAVGSSRPDRPT